MLQVGRYINVKAVMAVRTEMNVTLQNMTEESGFLTS